MAHAGRMLIMFGAAMLFLGLLLTLAGKIPLLGRLPGDIVCRGKNFTLYFPLTSSILLSALLTLILYLVRRLGG